MLVTEEWLLSDVQVRNPGLSRADYEQIFAEWLGINADDLARRGVRRRRHTWSHRRHRQVRRRKTRSCLRSNRIPSDENHARSMDNLHRLEHASKAPGVAALHIVTLPFPRAVMMNGERLPASYANFYIANDVVVDADLQRPERSRRAQYPRRTSCRREPSSASTPSISCGDWGRCTA